MTHRFHFVRIKIQAFILKMSLKGLIQFFMSFFGSTSLESLKKISIGQICCKTARLVVSSMLTKNLVAWN